MTNDGGTSPPANDEWLVAHERKRPCGAAGHSKAVAGAQPEATAFCAKVFIPLWSHACGHNRLRAKVRNLEGEPEPPQSKWCRSPVPASITERPSTRLGGGGACHQGAMWKLGMQEGVYCACACVKWSWRTRNQHLAKAEGERRMNMRRHHQKGATLVFCGRQRGKAVWCWDAETDTQKGQTDRSSTGGKQKRETRRRQHTRAGTKCAYVAPASAFPRLAR